MTLAICVLLRWSLANRQTINLLISTWKVFSIVKNIFIIMKNLTDFCKMVEISVDPCLYLVVFIQDYTQKESCLLRPLGNPYFSLKREFIGTSCIGSNRVKQCPQLAISDSLNQNEVKCSAFDMKMSFHSHANKTHFHKKGCALGLLLKVRVLGTKKWPIEKLFIIRLRGVEGEVNATSQKQTLF